ncbi:MAG: family 1 encapsulin nanocompartment shell protein [Sulfolobaceae archaeon]
MITRKEKFDREELLRALRAALAAEIDAINYYLQQNKLIDEPKLKAVHEDIVKEEIAHFGEFLRVLYEVAPEEFSYIKKGWEEASKLLGSSKDFPLQIEKSREGISSEKSSNVVQKEENRVIKWIFESISSNRIVRNIGELIYSYNNYSIPISEIKNEKDETYQGKLQGIYEIPYIYHTFKINLGSTNEENLKRITWIAGRRFVEQEEEVLLKSHPLSPAKIGSKISGGNWDQPGSIVADVVKAYEILAREGFSKEVQILVSPANYSKLFRIVDRSGVYELELIKQIGNIYVSSIIDETEIFVISKKGFNIIVSKDTNVEYLSKEKEYDVYLISEQIAPVLLSPTAACVIKR